MFLQNWLYTVLLGNYVGYGYLIWVGLVFAVLVDCVFNRARVSRAVMDVVGSIFSSAG